MVNKAFTLAEVLITLAIIGIVAAVTIPSVIANYQQQEFKTGLKKAVSVLNEAIQTNIIQEGETPYDNGSLFSYLQRHMNILKTDYLSTCFSASTGELVALNDSQGQCNEGGAHYSANQVFYTTDGMRFEFFTSSVRPASQYEFYLHESNLKAAESKSSRRYTELFSGGPLRLLTATNGYCGSYGLSNNPHNTINTPCIVIVDVNGDRKPNPPQAYARGRHNGYAANQPFVYTYASPTDKRLSDIFSIMITEDRAIPFGVVAQRAMYEK